MPTSKITTVGGIGSLDVVHQKSRAAISNTTTNQFFSATGANLILSGPFSNDHLGRWSAYDSGGGSVDSIRWNGGFDIDVFVTVSMAVRHNEAGSSKLYARNLCYLSGTIVSAGHLYAPAPNFQNATATSSARFPVTFSNGDYLYYTSRYFSSSGGTHSLRLEANLFHILVEER